jgi:hypothetical protein
MKDNCNVKVVTDVMYSFRVSEVFWHCLGALNRKTPVSVSVDWREI